jgi:NTE family protein
MLVEEVNFQDLLDDGGTKLNKVKERVGQISAAMSSGWLWEKFTAVNCKAPGLVKKLGRDLGLYPGNRLKDFLLEKIRKIRPHLKDHADITFQHLEEDGCPPVKIEASDITMRRPAVFSREKTEYGASVIDAVRASVGYPFAFQPVLKNDRRLVDGGLSSNLPAFLFESEYKETRIPAFAFDLIAPSSTTSGTYHLGHFGNDLLSTALEASDELMRRVLRGVHYVPVHTPLGIDTLDFNLPKDKRKLLFDTGYRAAEEFLANFVPLQRVKMAGDQLQKQLMAEYGSPQYYTPVLYALAKEIERTTKAVNVRSHIMLPTGRPEASRIVVYHYGMDDDNDADLELLEDAGCSGEAWANRDAAFADLREARKDPTRWKMTLAQHRKVPETQNSMLSVPIHRELNLEERDPPMPVGTLSVDSSTPLEDTDWITKMGSKLVAHPNVVVRMKQWAYIIHRLMP